MARQGMSWRHAPSHSQWRDGASEACVKMLKASLSHMTKPGRLTYDELLSLLTKAANRVNQRPLGVMHHQGSTPGYCPVTPNLLLMGSRTSKDELDVDQDTPDRYTRRFKFINDCFDSWWKQWYSQVFPSLVPVKKWRQRERKGKSWCTAMRVFQERPLLSWPMSCPPRVQPLRRSSKK